MVSARQIAIHILRLAAREQEFEPITHLRLQKLLYYVQGWSLAIRGRPMFLESIESWEHGPVVPEVWHVYKGHKATPLPTPPHRARITAADAEFVEYLWAHYKQFSATELRRKTHQERPWLLARGDDGFSREIDQTWMLDHFKVHFAVECPPGLELQRMEAAERAFEVGNEIVDFDEWLANRTKSKSGSKSRKTSKRSRRPSSKR